MRAVKRMTPGLEARVAVLEEYVLSNRDKIKQINEGVEAQTQTNMAGTDVDTQTEKRVNITERGNQVRPTTDEKETQTNPPVANRLISGMSSRVLPLFAKVSPEWLKSEHENDMLRHPIEMYLEALENVKCGNIRVDDVVLLCECSVDLLISFYSV